MLCIENTTFDLLALHARACWQVCWQPLDPASVVLNNLMTVNDYLIMSSAESESVETAPGGQPQGPFEVCLQYSGPAVLLWLWSNAHSSEDSGLKAQPIKHTAGNTGQSSHCFATALSLLN